MVDVDWHGSHGDRRAILNVQWACHNRAVLLLLERLDHIIHVLGAHLLVAPHHIYTLDVRHDWRSDSAPPRAFWLLPQVDILTDNCNGKVIDSPAISIMVIVMIPKLLLPSLLSFWATGRRGLGWTALAHG